MAGPLHSGHGVGRTYEGTCLILFVQDLQIRIINVITGESSCASWS